MAYCDEGFAFLYSCYGASFLSWEE
uniref:Uncharacterized protein n=1 Tax=Arundo donax TaxID=35708 RepID=A0A0A9BLC5_ARUDO